MKPVYETHEFYKGFTHNEHYAYIEERMKETVRQMQDNLSMAILSDPSIIDKIREENEKRWEIDSMEEV
jgi:hypothetical protein